MRMCILYKITLIRTGSLRPVSERKSQAPLEEVADTGLAATLTNALSAYVKRGQRRRGVLAGRWGEGRMCGVREIRV